MGLLTPGTVMRFLLSAEFATGWEEASNSLVMSKRLFGSTVVIKAFESCYKIPENKQNTRFPFYSY